MKKPNTAKELVRFYGYDLLITLLGFAVTCQFVEPACRRWIPAAFIVGEFLFLQRYLPFWMAT